MKKQIKYIVYVASPIQSKAVKHAIDRIGGKPIEQASQLSEGFMIDHVLLGNLKLEFHLITDLTAITPHLRINPVDLLVYDERGSDAIDAREALLKIQRDFQAFAELWGPDFLFPMSRVVAILEKKQDDDTSSARRAFEIGRVHVSDVCISPKNTATVLRWLQRILLRDSGKVLRTGIALSGGGIEGFLYQLGVMYALERALDGKEINSVEVFSGVSSGSICASILAAKIPLQEVIKALNQKSEILPSLTSSVVFDLAAKDIVSRIASESISFPGFHPKSWLKQTLRSIPTGFFKGDALKNYFKKCNEIMGHNDSFHDLESELYIGATDQDSFEHVVFGKDPWKSVPVSEAIRASIALPPVYLPAQLNGRWFIDGQVTRTCNLELVVERDCSLIFIIDPVKPLGTLIPGSVDKQGGIYAIIQAVKALVYTRFHSTLMHLTERYPNTDFLVFQPDEEVAQLMAGSPMRYRIRTQLIEMSYRQTMRQFRDRHKVYAAKLMKYGFKLKSKEELSQIEESDKKFFDSVRDGAN